MVRLSDSCTPGGVSAVLSILENSVSHSPYQPKNSIDKWRQCYTKVMSLCYVASQRIQEVLDEVYKTKMRYLMVSTKKNP